MKNNTRHNRETARLEAFSDGVFAIAITLLILDVKVPPPESVHSVNDLWQKLFELWPSFFALFYSFGNILIIWSNHHRVFEMISRSSVPFMYANGFLLLTVILIPFSTALLGQYIGTDYKIPVVVLFCFSSLLNSFAFIIWSHKLLKPVLLLDSKIDAKSFKNSIKATWTGFSIYCFTTLIAFWLPVTALVINTSILVLWIILSLKKYRLTVPGNPAM